MADPLFLHTSLTHTVLLLVTLLLILKHECTQFKSCLKPKDAKTCPGLFQQPTLSWDVFWSNPLQWEQPGAMSSV